MADCERGEKFPDLVSQIKYLEYGQDWIGIRGCRRLQRHYRPQIQEDRGSLLLSALVPALPRLHSRAGQDLQGHEGCWQRHRDHLRHLRPVRGRVPGLLQDYALDRLPPRRQENQGEQRRVRRVWHPMPRHSEGWKAAHQGRENGHRPGERGRLRQVGQNVRRHYSSIIIHFLPSCLLEGILTL